MAKIQKTTFLDANDEAILISAGNDYVVFKVPTIPEGRLGRIIVRQLASDTTPADFTVDVLELLPESLIEGEGTGSLPTDIDLYRVIPQQPVGGASSSVASYDSEIGYPYIAGSDPTIRTRYLYMIIMLDSSQLTDCHFEVVMVVESFYVS